MSEEDELRAQFIDFNAKHKAFLAVRVEKPVALSSDFAGFAGLIPERGVSAGEARRLLTEADEAD